MIFRLRTVLTVALPLLFVGQVVGQNVEFKANVPGMVTVEEPFQVSYEVNTKPDDRSFIPPESFGNFKIIAGPSLSHGRSTSIDFNTGNTVTAEKYEFTYVLQASAEGTFNIPSAKVQVKGKTYSSKQVPLEVVSAQAIGSSNPATLAEDDMLVRVIVNKNTVYKGQPIRVVFKLYSRVACEMGQSKFPALNGFWTTDLNFDRTQQRETYNGKVYTTLTLRDVLMIPQQTGQLHIEQFSQDVTAQLITNPINDNSLFDNMFGGLPNIKQVRKTLTAPGVNITVKELPDGAPGSFNGAVGSFQLSGNLSSHSLSANAAGTYTLKISGSGNLSLISPPKLELPGSFEQYSVKTSENFNANASGISGYKQFEYPFIARAEGAYTLDPVNFSYFDPEKGTYVTLSTGSQSMDIHPDASGGGSGPERGIINEATKEEVKILGNDIRYINLGNPHLRRKDNIFFLSPGYLAAVILIIAAFTALFFYLRKYLKNISNLTLIRNKKASKIAMQRLKTADAHLIADDKNGFYEEMLKALWGYMSYKLNIPVANLTKDTVREELLRKGIHEEKISEYIEIISVCESAQYSPQTPGRMDDVYNSAILLLSRLESALKKKK